MGQAELSIKVINKKLINRHCPIRKILLGDPNLVKLLKMRIGKNNFVSVDNEMGKSNGPGGFGKSFKKRNNLTMSLVKSSDPNPKLEERIERENLTELSDEEIFGQT